MPSPIQQKLMDISGLTSKLLRKSFGKGPQSCHAFANHNYLVFYIRGFLSPMESVLFENGNSDNIDISRNIVITNILVQLKGILAIEFQQDVEGFYHDWNYPNNTGMITVVFQKDIITASHRVGELAIESDRLIMEVNRLSALVEKTPEKTQVFEITPKVYLIKRDGILVPIEKILVKKGYQQQLLVTKDTLEKTYFHRDGYFEEIFKQPVDDIFIDWNVNQDNSMICFILK